MGLREQIPKYNLGIIMIQEWYSEYVVKKGV